MKICVYTICKNEINNIDKWLSCMCEADYMVLVDTGSNDGTYEKLSKLKSTHTNLIVGKINVSPFRFDVARNEAMKFIPKDTDICVSMDMDELFMEKGWSKVLKKLWKPEYELGDLIYIDNKENNIYNKKAIMPRTKIHTLKSIWKYPIHEIPVSNINETYSGEKLKNENIFYLWKNNETTNDWKKLILIHNSSNGSKSLYMTLSNMRCNEYSDRSSDEIKMIELFSNKKYEECLSFIEEIENKNYDVKQIEKRMYLSSIYFHKGYIYETQKRNILMAIKYYEKSLEEGIINYKSIIQLCNLYCLTNQRKKILPIIQEIVENWTIPYYTVHIKELDELHNFYKEELTKYYNLCK